MEPRANIHLISSSDLASPLRYVGNLVLSNPDQLAISVWNDGQLHIKSVGEIENQVAIAYGLDLAPSIPSSGSGTLTSLDILPFEPLLDLSEAESLRLTLQTDAPLLSITMGMLDSITRHIQIVTITAIPSDRFVDVPISAFSQISHAGIGQLFFQVNLFGSSNTSFSRFEVVPEPSWSFPFGIAVLAILRRNSKFQFAELVLPNPKNLAFKFGSAQFCKWVRNLFAIQSDATGFK